MTTIPNSIDGVARVDLLVADLANNDPIIRERARQSLVAHGSKEVTAALVVELTNPRAHVRWEAAKALAALADPVSAPALVHALDDENENVRWLAAEGLAALGQTGVTAVLGGLEKCAGSTAFCRSAHHVLSQWAKKGNAKAITPVLIALTGPEPGASVPPAVYEALKDLKGRT